MVSVLRKEKERKKQTSPVSPDIFSLIGFFVSIFFLWIHFALLNCSTVGTACMNRFAFLLVRILYEFLLALTCGLATEGGIVTITKTASILLLPK